MSTFKTDLANGQRVEKEIAAAILPMAITPEFQQLTNTVFPPGKFSDYDFRMSISVEVKADFMSAKTGNVAFEVYSRNSKKPTGIMASKSNVFVMQFKHETVYFDTVALQVELNQLSDNKSPHIRKLWGGDNASVGLILVPLKYVVSEFTSIIKVEKN